jgi:tRNA pseudouridine13 synthase
VANVGFAGLKDRQALTTQWFSVLVANRPEPNWRSLDADDITVIDVSRHRRKLRRGGIATNQFKLRLRDLQGTKKDLMRRLERVASDGVPNYFGPQRFGRDGNNLAIARAMLGGWRMVRSRPQRGLYLSAVRAFLFNRVLAERVANGTWNQAIPGDVMMLDGSHSVFALLQPTDVINERLARQDIHPTGPLWGRGQSLAQNKASAIESEVLAPYRTWCQSLERAGLTGSRRALRVAVRNLCYRVEAEHTLHLQFMLGPGSYATTVLRELVSLR